MEKDDTVSIAVSLGFSMINLILEYLRKAGISEEVIEANWAMTKQKVYSRPSDKLPEVPDEEEP